MLDSAIRTEYVRIPMGGAPPRSDQPIVGFGAAAGYVNPTSGYSVVHSMTSAPRVAAAIASALGDSPAGSVAAASVVWNAVWPSAARRTRVLHDYGLDLLVGLDPRSVRQFFSTFFELPTDTWASYMRTDTSPRELAAVMAQMFSAAPWSIRRRLISGNPLALARLFRPG